ncbi:MAG: hypothetical protein R6T98_15255 [Desulfatiglandales bacterium]
MILEDEPGGLPSQYCQVQWPEIPILNFVPLPEVPHLVTPQEVFDWPIRSEISA